MFALILALESYSKKKLYEAPTEVLQRWHQPSGFKVAPIETSKSFPPTTKMLKLAPSVNTEVNIEALAGLPFVTPLFSVASINGVPISDTLEYRCTMPLPAFADGTSCDGNFPFLSDACKNFFLSHVCKTLQEATDIEQDTKHQSQSAVWLCERGFRLTASNAKQIIHCKEETIPEIIESLISPPDISHLLAIKLGREREPVIRNMIRHEYNGMYVLRNTGLCIHPQFPFLGASPDGLLFNPQEPMLLEIKTALNLQHNTLEELIMTRTDFCLGYDQQGQIILKETHKYFYQVQQQMLCANVHKCLFVLFYDFDKPLYKCVIDFDEKWSKRAIPVLSKFYFSFFLPALAKCDE